MRAQYLLLPALLPAMIGLGACVVHRNGGVVEYSSKTIEPDDSELVHVTLRMGAGELRVIDTAQALLRADFTYNVPDWKPEVRYTKTGKTGDLSIIQPGNTHNSYIGSTKY